MGTRGASAGSVVEALLIAACAPPAERRASVERVTNTIASFAGAGVVSARYLDAADDAAAACLADLAPASASSQRFLRARQDLSAATADFLADRRARTFVGFPDVAFSRVWGALVLGLDDLGVRRVSQLSRLQHVAVVAGWVWRSTRDAGDAATASTKTATGTTGTTGVLVDAVPHGVVFHLAPAAPPIINRVALGLADAWERDHDASPTAWDHRRFLLAHRALDQRTAPEISRLDGRPRWWRRTTVVDAEGGALLGMLTEFGPLGQGTTPPLRETPPETSALADRARAAFANIEPPIDDEEWAVIDEVVAGHRLSTAARELGMGERRTRELMRNVLARVDRQHQAELAILLRRGSSPA